MDSRLVAQARSGAANGADVHGVEIHIVCSCIPVVSLYNSSDLASFVSTALQAGLSSMDQVDSLYEYCHDDEICVACYQAGYKRADDLLIANLTREDLRHVKGVGTTKRSIILALVLSLAGARKDALDNVLDSLAPFHLDQQFQDLMQACGEPARRLLPLHNFPLDGMLAGNIIKPSSWSMKMQNSSVQKANFGYCGIDVVLVCQHVPVVAMEATSAFHQYVSSMFQAALQVGEKTGELYEYLIDADDICDECRSMGIAAVNDLMIVRLTVRQWQHIRGAGMCGKRSAMLALVIALVRASPVALRELLDFLREYELEEKFINILRLCEGVPLSEIQPQEPVAPLPQPKKKKHNKISLDAAPPVGNVEPPSDEPGTVPSQDFASLVPTAAPPQDLASPVLSTNCRSKAPPPLPPPDVMPRYTVEQNGDLEKHDEQSEQARADRAKWAELFQYDGHVLQMKALNKRINNEELCTIADFMHHDYFPKMWKPVQSTPLWLDEIDLGSNQLEGHAIRQLTTALIEHRVPLRVLKLQRNNVESSGAQAVADFIQESPLPPAEIHMSHNFLGPSDVRRLIVAAAYRREYPFQGHQPLWLRVERQQGKHWDAFVSNEVRWQRTKEMVAYAEYKIIEIRTKLGILPPSWERTGELLCLPEFLSKCKNSMCVNRHEYGPIIQLPYLWEQGTDFLLFRGTSVEHTAPPVASEKPSEWMMKANGSSNVDAVSSAKAADATKTEVEILYTSETAMVLNKGPAWVCKWNAFSKLSSTMVGFPKQLHRDSRSWEDMVRSGRWEYFDAYLARRFDDEMAQGWWRWQENPAVGREPAAGAGCVHRLDKDTSGCIIRARTFASFAELKAQLQKVGFQKHYLCLVHTHVPGNGVRHEITARLGCTKNPHVSIEAYVDHYSGEWAETRVWCLAHLVSPCRTEKYSLCEVRILTGRTHQIRVHLEHMHWPLVSDPKYNAVHAWQDNAWCPRIFLHAWTVSFNDAGKDVEVFAPLPTDLRKALLSLHIVTDFTQGQVSSCITENWNGLLPTCVLHERDEMRNVHTMQDPESELEAEILTTLRREGPTEFAKLARNQNILQRIRRLKNGSCDDDEVVVLKNFVRLRESLFCSDMDSGIVHMQKGARPEHANQNARSALDSENGNYNLSIELESDLQNMLWSGPAELSKLAKDPNIRIKLRRLQCGGVDAQGDVARLIAFARPRSRVFLVDTDGGMLHAYKK